MRPFPNLAYIVVLIVLIALIAVRSREEGGAHPSAIDTGVFQYFTRLDWPAVPVRVSGIS